jgi:aspartate kinase
VVVHLEDRAPVMLTVMKFGGTSVGDPAAVERLVGIVNASRAKAGAAGGPMIVVSALAGVTDRLIEATRIAGGGDGDGAVRLVDDLHVRHREMAALVRDAGRRSALLTEIDRRFTDLTALVRAFAVLHEVTPRSLDATVAAGELMSSRIVTAALADAGLPATWFDPRALLVTDAAHTAAAPNMDATAARLAQVVTPALASGEIPVTAGFVGATEDAVTTTLGRGGSDYSAAIFGACLKASEIQIWTDVDGMLTADPRLIDAPQVVPTLTFAEASELAYFGAKVLHPSTIAPAVADGIPVRILNSRRPSSPGTLITASAARRESPLAAIACKRGITVVDITSTRMLMAYGFLRRLFEVFERFNTPVDVVTTSEVSVSVTIDDRRNLPRVIEALSAFADVSCEHDMAIVCAVGEHLHDDPLVFARVMRSLEGLTLRMVSQAASRRNLTCVLREADLALALARLHAEFFGEEPAARTGSAASAPTGARQ